MITNVLRHDTQCRLCGSDRITTVFRLNETPLEDQFVTTERKAVPQPTYPLELAMCDSCGYVHLPHIVSPEASYADYVYESSVTVGLRSHYDDYAQEIVGEFSIPEGALIVDLGSNDGSMLASFKRLGMNVVGVEPASAIATQASQSGLTTINEFFTSETASTILANHGSARVVTANYMYANIDDVIGFTKAVSTLLAPDGIFVVQTGYHPEQMKIKMFDYIYHEHFSYFTVEVLMNLFSACGLELIHAKKTTPKGGSIRVLGQLRNGPKTMYDSVRQLIEEEHQQGVRDPETYGAFARDIGEVKTRVRNLLIDLKAAGKTIVGFGASHSTTTLIYHFGLAPFIDYLVDDNRLKHGRYSPGYHLPVYSSTKLYEETPDYAIVLGWQHQKAIMERHHKYLTNSGHWIVPLPHLQVI